MQEVNGDQDGTSQNPVILRLQKQIESMLMKTEHKKGECLRLDNQIEKLNQSIEKYRLKLGGIFAHKQNESFVSKQRNIMENRIMKTKRDFMEAKAYAQQIRLEIDVFRREELLSKDAIKDMESSYEETLVSINALEATIAERDKLTEKLVVVRDKHKQLGESKEGEYSEEWVGVDLHLKNEIAKIKVRKMTTPILSQRGTMTKEDENEILTVNKATEFENSTKALKSAKTVKMHATLQAAFQQISEQLNFYDPDIMVQETLKLDAVNFDLYTYVGVLEAESASIRQHIRNIKTKIKEEKEIFASENNGKSSVIAQINKSIQSLNEQTAHTHNEYLQKMNYGESVRSGLEKIFNTIKSKHADDDAMMEDLYKTDDLSSVIKIKNMEQYVGVLELKVGQFIRQVAVAQKIREEALRSPANKRRKSALLTPQTPASPFADSAFSFFDESFGETVAQHGLKTGPATPTRDKMKAKSSIRIDAPTTQPPKRKMKRNSAASPSVMDDKESGDNTHETGDVVVPLSREELELEVRRSHQEKTTKSHSIIGTMLSRSMSSRG